MAWDAASKACHTMPLVLAWLIMMVATPAAASPRHLLQTQIAAPQWYACAETVLVLPALGGETILNNADGPSKESNNVTSGACVKATGSVTLVNPTTLAFYEASGTFVFWAPFVDYGTTNCGNAPNLDSDAAAYFARNGLISAGATWTGATCCVGITTCNGTNARIWQGPITSKNAIANDWAIFSGFTTSRIVDLDTTLYNSSLATQGSAAGCYLACAITPGCASFLYSRSSAVCQLLSSEPSSTSNTIVPCSTSDCVFGFRMPGSCGRTASTSIRCDFTMSSNQSINTGSFTIQNTAAGVFVPVYKYSVPPGRSRICTASQLGKFWPGWIPSAGRPTPYDTTDLSNNPWSQDNIPDSSQGKAAASVSECACRCASVPTCTAYTWMPGSRVCYLQSWVQSWSLFDTDSTGTTVLGRVYTPGTAACSGSSLNSHIGIAPFITGSKRITVSAGTTYNRTFADCYADCFKDPACQTLLTNSSVVAGLVTCTLLSEIGGGSYVTSSNVRLTQIQRCDAGSYTKTVSIPNLEWQISKRPDIVPSSVYLALLTPSGTDLTSASSVPIASDIQQCFGWCHDTAGCGAAVFVKQTGVCYTSFEVTSPPTYTARPAVQLFNDLKCNQSDTQCLVVSRVPGYCGFSASSGVLQLGQKWKGWTPGTDFGSWGSAADIEVVLQNATVSSVSDCACRCQTSIACIGYVVLLETSQCWLQSRVDFSVGYEQGSTPALYTAATGRLAIPAGKRPDCSKSTISTRPDVVPYTFASTKIFRVPNPFFCTDAVHCNEACLFEPFCLAWALRNSTSDQSVCELYSHVVSGGTTTELGTLYATVQRCSLVALGLAGDETSASPRIKIGLVVGVAVGGLALLLFIAVVIVVWRRRRTAQLQQSIIEKWKVAPKDHLIAKGASDGNGSHPQWAPLQTVPLLPGQSSAQAWSAASQSAVQIGLQVTSSESTPSSLIATRQALSSKIRASQQANQQLAAKELAVLTGLTQGDPFLTSVAPLYKWSSEPMDGMMAVEEGVNADMLTRGNKGSLPEDSVALMEGGPEPVELTPQEMLSDIEIMAKGMIGRGATAVVFKCRWPSKFGPNALLAIKCLRDPYAFDAANMVQSFTYEAYVLSKCKHENIVRMYGYCLEPPCVCIIMELLPGSLKDRLHGSGVHKSSSAVGSHPDNGAPADPGSGQSGLINSPFAAMSSGTPLGSMHLRNPSSGAGLTTERSLALHQRSGSGQQQGNHSSQGGTLPSTESNNLSIASGTKMEGRKSGFLPISHEPPPPLTPAEIVQIGKDMSAGLAHLHSKPEARVGMNAYGQVTVSDQLPGDVGQSIPEQDDTDRVDDVEDVDEVPVERSKLNRVVHRDLKPANILINSKGRAKISDFGLAREHQNTAIHTQHLGAGTLTYMAPELLIGGGAAAITDKIDIYSLGVILWELIAAQLPWKGYTDIQIATMVQAGQRPALPGQPGPVQFPGDLALIQQLNGYASLVRACWQQKPHRRPAATAVLKLLNNMIIVSSTSADAMPTDL